MNKGLKRITYVEDEPDIRAIAELALTMVGNFTIDVCSNGTEAIEKAPVFGPDLILLDIMMPGMNGIETFRLLQAIPETAGIPVIFMTAKAQKHEVEGYKDLGAVDVIPKPFDPMTLAHDITAIWNRINAEKAA